MSPSTTRVPAATSGAQGTFDQLEPLLSEVTFVVVDLETTGTRPGTDEITEIGAVRVQGGEVRAELSTFVAISGSLPRHISRLTGIVPGDLIGAPSLGEVMATFLEFSRGAVLVAHNARFDLGFLRAAAATTGHPWPDPPSVCTLALARRVLHRGETRGHRLGVLAAHLGSTVEPNHRALQDARATVDVLHALISRVGDCGVGTVSELRAYDGRLTPEVRRRSSLTESLTSGPGVYIFRDEAGGPLYVGSSGAVRRRARSYYSGGDARGRMRTMVGLAAAVESVPCTHLLEAWTVEERLIDSLQPPFNRCSRSPRRGWWLAPPSGRAIRGQVTRNPEHPFAVGPFRRADDARSAWLDLSEAGDGAPDTGAWAALVTGRDSAPLRAVVARIDELAADGAFERAARLRDRAATLVRILARQQELAATAGLTELVLVQAGLPRTWSVAIVRHGRLAASGTVPTGAAPLPVIDSLRAAATTVLPGPGPLAGATAAEIGNVHRWIDSAPTRIVTVEGSWVLPLDGAHTLNDWADRAERAAAGVREPEVSDSTS
ncbi:DEDD exonuclease domain-containing protein [Rhodococcus sp. IEGM 1408]|uniref:DEDD exonuclease domain-containing protein n=1 Tax=Rhodococcus sp. IEGM 1408 TaxID=3082220 RepID=UPI0029539868|nr:DEDD exonuclease domain-containing protein [Rhodococcus sp. IEGM 1408]MDV8001878.1 DEDD exonuclease domain-containing protein [Rhodococcus sp. IEGM 1408]